MGDYMTTAEAAAELGVKIRRVQQLIESGALPARRFGQVWMVRRADVTRAKGRKTKRGWPKGRPRKARD